MRSSRSSFALRSVGSCSLLLLALSACSDGEGGGEGTGGDATGGRGAGETGGAEATGGQGGGATGGRADGTGGDGGGAATGGTASGGSGDSGGSDTGGGDTGGSQSGGSDPGGGGSGTGATSSWCDDDDDDSFGDPADCDDVPDGVEPPAGSVPVASATDCDDDDEHAFPGAAELDSEEACMADADGDGFGDSAATGAVTPGTDCDDGDEHTFPGAAPSDDPVACMTDADGDDYGSTTPTAGVTSGSDCDDGDELTFACVAWCEDTDLDGSGDPASCQFVAPADTPPAGSVDDASDCAPGDGAVFPGAAAEEPTLCTRDLDGDGWGDAAVSATHAAADDGSDCLDSDEDTFPGAAEADDTLACLRDADGDGWGDDAAAAPVAAGRDCDDADPSAVVCVTMAPQCTETLLGQGVELLATAEGGDGAYTYSWGSDPTLSALDVANPIATPTEITTYQVTVTDDAGNAGQQSATVHLTDEDWVLGGAEADCVAVGFLGAAAPHSFANGDTTTCTTANSDPTAYVCPTVHRSARIEGTMVVNPPVDDDDYIGFVWGYQSSDQYYLLTWKQGAQNIGGCTSAAGMTVKLVNRVQSYAAGDFTCNTSTPNTTVLLAPAQTTTAGWVHGVTYAVTLEYEPDQTHITIVNTGNDAVVADFVVDDATYPSGQFGTFDYSQIRSCNGPWTSSCL